MCLTGEEGRDEEEDGDVGRPLFALPYEGWGPDGAREEICLPINTSDLLLSADIFIGASCAFSASTCLLMGFSNNKELMVAVHIDHILQSETDQK